MNASHFCLKLFATPGLFDERGIAIRLPTRHCLHILAVLQEAEGAFVDRLALAAAVWPDAGLAEGRNRLRTALAAIRAVLPTQSIETRGSMIALAPEVVVSAAPKSITELAQFMPGFDTEWAIDRRIRYRQEAVASQLAQAAKEKNPGKRLEKLEAALHLDPLSEEAANARVEELRRQGRVPQAVQAADAYRIRLAREMGVLPELPTPPTIDLAPLVRSAEWLLHRDPAQALAFLVSTESFWHGYGLRQGLALYDRALAACRPSEPGYQRAQAQRFYLLATVGQLYAVRAEAEALLESALQRGEAPTACRLAMALSYANLSNGHFDEALRYARRALDHGAELSDQELRRETGIHLSIVEQHTGRLRQSRATISQWASSIEAHGSPRERAQLLLTKSSTAFEAGKLEVASDCLTQAERLYQVVGATRSLHWVEYEVANLHAKAGENYKAREILRRLVNLDPEEVGHSLLGMAEDTLAWVESRLGEMDSAVESLARSYAQRRKLGTVPSLYEQRFLRSARASATRRLGEHQVKKIFQEALQSGRMLVS